MDYCAASIGQNAQDYALQAANQQYGSHSSYYAFSNGNTRPFDQNSQVPRTQTNPFLTSNFFNMPPSMQANEFPPTNQFTVHGTQTPYHESPQQTYRSFDPHAPLTLEQQQYLHAQFAVTRAALSSVGTHPQQRYSQVNPTHWNQPPNNQFGEPLSLPPTILAPPVLPKMFRPENIVETFTLVPNQSKSDFEEILVTRTKVMGSAEPGPKALISFHLFPRLPVEIRMRIFVTALSNIPGKHIQLVAIQSPTTETSFFNPANPPCPIRQVCKEARYGLFNDCIQINNIQDWKGITRPIAFNPDKDCLVFDCDVGVDKLLQFAEIVGVETAQKIQKICNITNQHKFVPFNTEAESVKLCKVLAAFQSLRELQVLLSGSLVPTSIFVDGQLWDWRLGRKGYRVEEVSMPQGMVKAMQTHTTFKFMEARQYALSKSWETCNGVPKVVMMDLIKESDPVPMSYDSFTNY